MLEFNVKNRVIDSLKLDNENIILPWGIETADSWSFFSMEDGIGYRHKVLSFNQSITSNSIKSSFHVVMKEGEWRLETEDLFFENKIIRKAKLVPLKESNFMDFVIRFRFNSEDYLSRINNQTIHHNSLNKYYQYPVDCLSLNDQKLNIHFKMLSFNGANKFAPYMYVRDQKKEWIVHARLIPKVEDFAVIKLCSKYFKTSPLPHFFAKFLLNFPKVKKYLWYRGEHSPYRNKIAKIFSPIAFPLVTLGKSEEISMEVEVEFVRV